ncbi:hypothetical protein F4778DRAFT_794537 [Xylariomycetidae sp. FL2044]|nr:hypothetical protein F4778DRAFT_794537 [Xylariomycetidae sp. FL2044]
MAEALGIAASGIAVAQITTQVGTAVIRLKQLWDQVKDVPDDIAYLLEQLDCLDPILCEIEATFDQPGISTIVANNAAARRSAAYCREASKALAELVDDMSLQLINTRGVRQKIKSVKILLKKDTLRKYEKRLRHAVQILSLAQQAYSVALTRVQPDIIMHKFTTMMAVHSSSSAQLRLGLVTRPESQQVFHAKNEESDKTTETELSIARRQTAPKTTNARHRSRFHFGSNAFEQVAALRLPMWLSGRAWELYSSRAQGAWQWSLRSYNTRPVDSEVFSVVMEGDIDSLRRMFDMGLASPYDRTRSNKTLLHIAMSWRHTEIVRYLSQIGADPWHQEEESGFTPFQSYLYNSSSEIKISFASALLAKGDWAEELLVFPQIMYGSAYHDSHRRAFHAEPNIVEAQCNCMFGLHDKNLYMNFLKYQCPSHETTTLESRMRAAAHAVSFSDASAEVIRSLLLPELGSDPRIFQIDARGTCPPIAIVAMGLGRSQAFMTSRKLHSMQREQEVEIWSAFASDVIRITPDIHIIYKDPKEWGKYGIWSTALIAFLAAVGDSALERHEEKRRIGRVNRSLWLWLKTLKQSGVDLEKYGHREDRILRRELSDGSGLDLWYYSEDPHWEYYFANLRLLGFKFGPEPEDWSLYWSEPRDAYAGDFWQLIEDPPLQLPGAWVD